MGTYKNSNRLISHIFERCIPIHAESHDQTFDGKFNQFWSPVNGFRPRLLGYFSPIYALVF